MPGSPGTAGLLAVEATAVFFLAVVVLTFGENLVTIPPATLPSNLGPQGGTGLCNGAFTTVATDGFLAPAVFGGFLLANDSNPLLIWEYLLVPAVPAVVLFRLAAGPLARAQDMA